MSDPSSAIDALCNFQVVATCLRHGATRTKESLGVGEGSLKEWNRFCKSVRGLVCVGEVIPVCERLKMVRAERSLGVGEGSLIERNGFSELAGSLTGAREVVPGIEGIWVVGT